MREEPIGCKSAWRVPWSNQIRQTGTPNLRQAVRRQLLAHGRAMMRDGVWTLIPL